MTEALSAALFHFLWQGAILALVPTLALMFRSPWVRYAAACVALFAMPVAFVMTFLLSMPQGGHAIALSEFHPFAPVASGDSRAWAQPFNFEQSMRWFVPFWLAGVVVFYVRTLGSWVVVQRMRRNSSAPAPAVWRQRLDELASRLGIRRAVALLASELVDVPVVAGFLRPVIFVPAALFTGMPAEQLEYLLIHELAHIRRFDYAVNLLQKAVEGLLFYHPAVWWVSRILRTERENCCDDAVVATRGNAREYASVLASLEQGRNVPALAASDGNLAKRVVRLLNRPSRFAAGPAFGVLVLAICSTVAWAALQRQTVGIEKPSANVAAVPAAQAVAPGPVLLAQARPAAAPPSVPAAGSTPDAFRKWLNEDVAYIIQDQERAAFKRLADDPEREHFIEQFWLVRDPTPGTPVNEFKEEHYRRIAFANAHFESSIPGWKTDRGRIYITFGPPDEIDAHPTDAMPSETWKYRYIEGIGKDVVIWFTGTEYQIDPEKGSPGVPREPPMVKLTPNGAILVLALDPERSTDVFVRITTNDLKTVAAMRDRVEHKASLDASFVLKSGSYIARVATKDDAPGSVTLTATTSFIVP